MRLLRKFLALTPLERRLVVRASVLVTLVRLCLGRISFSTLRRLATGSGARGGRAGVPDATLGDLAVWAVEAASHCLPGRTTCLTRALAVQGMLARSGQASRLHVGVVRGQQRRLEAHAWVEYNGRIIVGGSPSDVGQFTPLAAFGVETMDRGFAASPLRTLLEGR
jgi:hypothetical protein